MAARTLTVESVATPSCAKCSREWSQRTGIAPARVPVERFLFMRDLSRGYLVVAHCHGASTIVLLGPECPSDLKLGSLVIQF